MIDLNDLIGKPFVDGGRGPVSYDCFGLAREVFKRHGIGFPDVNVSVCACDKAQSLIDHTILEDWETINVKEVPCAILFQGFEGFANHIGVYIGEGVFIHTNMINGAMIEHLHSWKHKVIGYYKYVGNNNNDK